MNATYRIASVLSFAYFTIAALGKNGSYREAIEAAVMFFAIWFLGRGSARGQE